MDTKSLGKKIKEARLAKKMTQSDVVGDFITRNMLSQIESGSAYPSIKTLEYLAGVLEIPLKDLVDENSGLNIEESDAVIFNVLGQAKAAYFNKAYEAAIEKMMPLAVEGNELYDEACAILALSHLALAIKLEKKEQLRAAAENARTAEHFSSCGIYANREVRTSALLLLDKLAEKISSSTGSGSSSSKF